MTAAFGAGMLLELVAEPAFVTDRSGRILEANKAAAAEFPVRDGADGLADVLGVGVEDIDDILRASERTATALPSALMLGPERDVRYRVQCLRLTDPDKAMRFGVRVMRDQASNFAALTRTVEQLKSEVRQRALAQNRLEEAVSERELLLRELQHRIKNTIQIQSILLNRQAREAGNEQFKELVSVANQRLLTIAKSYDFMYRARDFRTVSAKNLLEAVVSALRETHAEGAEVDLSVSDDWQVPGEKAAAFSLVVNELMINAFKHGLDDGAGGVRIEFGRAGDHFRLLIEDSGEGFPEDFDVEKGSGLALVNSLCSKFAGELKVFSGDKGRCEILIDPGSDA